MIEAGHDTARQVGETLRDLVIDAAYTSPLQRAKTTAEVILSCFATPPSLQATEKLMEIDLPLWEGLLRQDVIDKFPEDYRCWQEQPHKFCMTISGETTQVDHFPVLSVFEQAQEFWQEILSRHRGQTILVIAHNGINRALIATAIGISPAYYHGIQQSNCGISILNFGDGWGGPVQLESLNITSHLKETLPKPRVPHLGPRLLLVRHGETDWNKAGKFQGQIDVPLNDTGREQSRRAGEFLKQIPLDFAVSSPMVRPKETAEIILQHQNAVPLQLYGGLSEISHGLWEGRFESEIEASYPGLLTQWKTRPETVQMPEGENLQQVWTRAIASWREIVQSVSGTGLVVAHDAINKAILCHLFGLDPAHFWKFKQGNGAVSVIDYPAGPEGAPVLQAMNITTHLSGSILDRTAVGAL